MKTAEQIERPRTTAPEMISLDKICTDGGTQPRSQIDTDLVAEYAEAMQEGDKFPAVFVVSDGKTYWLWDGFHRYHAAGLAGHKTLLAEVTFATLEDARWLALS